MGSDATADRIQLRERRIDEALKESFPASDPPYFVGGGALQPETLGPEKLGPDVAVSDPGRKPITGKKSARKKR